MPKPMWRIWMYRKMSIFLWKIIAVTGRFRVRSMLNEQFVTTKKVAHPTLSCRDPRGWIIPSGRPQASWSRQVVSYLRDTGMAGLASAWTMARRRPKEYRRKLDATTRCSGECPHTCTDLTYMTFQAGEPEQQDKLINLSSLSYTERPRGMPWTHHFDSVDRSNLIQTVMPVLFSLLVQFQHIVYRIIKERRNRRQYYRHE